MTKQLQSWKGDFGKDYTDRSYIDWNTRVPIFKEILGELPLETILEVGCNRGHNLKTLQHIFGSEAKIWGIEPNQHALDLAWQQELDVVYGDAANITFQDSQFDLVFTIGVLIHIPTEQLPNVLKEIYRVSKRYIFAVEYFSIVDTPISYRGESDLLWKRNFKEHYLSQFPDLRLVKEGFVDIETIDKDHWWLFEKGAQNG